MVPAAQCFETTTRWVRKNFWILQEACPPRAHYKHVIATRRKACPPCRRYRPKLWPGSKYFTVEKTHHWLKWNHSESKQHFSGTSALAFEMLRTTKNLVLQNLDESTIFLAAQVTPVTQVAQVAKQSVWISNRLWSISVIQVIFRFLSISFPAQESCY